MKLVGITGPTGAGKTTVLQVVAQLGGHAIDCDAVYHTLLDGDRAMQAALLARFATLSRAELAAIVFSDQAALLDLNRITHAFVGQEVARQIAYAKDEKRPFVAIDAIALIESGLGARCDATIAVLAPMEIRIGRIMAREGISQEAARRRAEAQKPNEFFIKHCTHVLQNTGSPGELHEQARLLFNKIIFKK